MHPKIPRALTPREMARLQTFPDDFVFKGAISSQFRQIGNAVAVEFAEHLGDMLISIQKHI